MMGTSLRPWVNMVVLNGNVYGVPSDGSQMFEIPPSEIPVGLKQFLGDEKDDPDTCTPEEAILLTEQEIKIANLICENHRLKGLLNDAGIAYIYGVKGEEK